MSLCFCTKRTKGVSLYISPTTLYFSCYSELFRDFESHSNSAFENTTLSEINTIFIYTCDDIVSCFTVMFLITAIIDDIDNLHHNELVSFQWVIKISSNSTKHLFERKPFNSCYRIWDNSKLRKDSQAIKYTFSLLIVPRDVVLYIFWSGNYHSSRYNRKKTNLKHNLNKN